MQCQIDWNGLSLAGWEERFSCIRRAPLLQSYDYARAACPLYRQRARWGLIRIDGAEAGLVQLLEAGLGRNLLHAVILDRGPLWLPGYGTPAQGAAFFSAFDREFPARFGRRRRILPETATLAAPSLRRKPGRGYTTIWLDLTMDMEILRERLAKNWRGALRKAEKADLRLEWSGAGAVIDEFIAGYNADRAQKSYGGPSPRLLRALGNSFAAQDRLIIGRVFAGGTARELLDNQPIAAILLLCHGVCATYQAGWSSASGRQAGAHNLLLWQAVGRLKELGYKDFDLGGINDETAKGVTDFKLGMGGETVVAAGHYF